MLEFDWYQATVPETDPHDLIENLLYGAPDLRLIAGNPGYNRPSSYRGEAFGGSIGVYFGTDNDVHVQGTGPAAPHVAQVVRALYPKHKVSRVDVALDFDYPDSFDLLWRRVAFIATSKTAGRPVGTRTAGDWLEAKKGRTLYAGSNTSPMMIRVYEKGFEQAAKHPEQTFSADWTRVEWQIRPPSRSKAAAALASPSELAAWTPFGALVLEVIAALKVEPFRHPPIPDTPPEYWLARQYGPQLKLWLALPPEAMRPAMEAAIELAASSPSAPVRTSTGTEFLPPGGLVLDRA